MLKKILLKLTVEGDLYKLRGDGSSPTLVGFFRASKGAAMFWKVRNQTIRLRISEYSIWAVAIITTLKTFYLNHVYFINIHWAGIHNFIEHSTFPVLNKVMICHISNKLITLQSSFHPHSQPVPPSKSPQPSQYHPASSLQQRFLFQQSKQHPSVQSYARAS